MRHGLCRLLECISIAGLELSKNDFSNVCTFVEESIKLAQDDVQASTVRAFDIFSSKYDFGEEYLDRLLNLAVNE